MDIVTFVELTVGVDTYLFGYASEQQIDYNHIPSLKSVRVRPAILNPGESIGERESVTINFIDHLHRFDADQFDKGTFWTKFRARYNTIEGSTLRVIRGIRGQQIEDMDSYLYIAQTLQISRSGAVIQAKDPLAFLDSKAAQAPRATQGEISAPLGAAAMAFTLTPVGIGDLQYPAGPARGVLGGKEVIEFTRVGDNITITARGLNIPPEDHDQDTKFQLALWYEGQLPSFIVNDLLTNYTEVDSAWIPLADWQQSVDAFINRVYTATVAEPTSVKKLLDELCEQVGLVFYWDPFAKKIRLRPLVATATAKSVNEDVILDGSFEVKEQPDKRVSQVWTYYGQRDPCESVDEVNNYRRVVVKLAPNELDFPQPAIRKIFSRWIPFQGRTTAEKLNDLIIARYQIPPRSLSFDLFRNKGFTTPPIGAYIDVNHWFLVDADGDQITLNAQVTSVEHDDAEISYEAEEVRFAGDDPIFEPEPDKYVFIESDVFNINLRTLYNQIYTTPNPGDNIYFVIESGVRVGSAVPTLTPDDSGVPALDVGAWPEAVNLTLVNNGRIQGLGGKGANCKAIVGGDPPSVQGAKGGTALYTRRAITIENNGSIWGGGGGGSVGLDNGIFDGLGDLDDILRHTISVGGGGAGFNPGNHGDTTDILGVSVAGEAQPGTDLAGGVGGGIRVSSGGNPGLPGGDAWGGVPGGPAGTAIDGASFVVLAPAGSVLGPQIN